MPVHLNYFTIGYINNVLSLKNINTINIDHKIKIHSLIKSLFSLILLTSIQKIYLNQLDR